ncbi:MAG: NYN domain-containing protein [Minisyncoccia bacterium]
MLVKHKDQRIAVLIDIQNLYHSAKNLYSARVNFKNLLLEVVEGRHLIRAIGYVVKADEPGEASFFDALEKAGIEPKIKDLQVYPDGTKKGDWDVGLAIDAVRLSNKVDVIIIASGDGDFIPLVDYLINQGVQVEIAAFGRTTATLLKEIVDNFIDLDLKTENILLKGEDKKIKRFPRIIRIK